MGHAASGRRTGVLQCGKPNTPFGMITCLVRPLADGFELDDNPARIDRAAVHRYLSEESYWAEGRPRAVMDELIATAARVVGLYAPDGRQLGFARVVSDRHTVSYLADVFVLEEVRGNGFGLELVRFAVDHEPIASTKLILHTRDMHPLYAKLGFAPPDARLMERWPVAATRGGTAGTRIDAAAL